VKGQGDHKDTDLDVTESLYYYQHDPISEMWECAQRGNCYMRLTNTVVSFL
jgi:hypothetical protein